MSERIRLEHITKIYDTDNQILNDLSLTVDKGEFVAVIGKSGSGKTTLVNIVGQLDTDYEGEYFYEQENARGKNLIGHKISFVFQSYNLLDRFSVYENICMPFLYQRDKKRRSEKEIHELLEKLDILSLCDKKINSLSGGEKQRVAIARSILMDAQLLIADEPTGNLDRKNTEIVMEILSEQAKAGVSIILITHDESLISYVDTVYHLQDGHLV